MQSKTTGRPECLPKLKLSMDYCINTWDPDHTGTLMEPHHNTYDIEFLGADGMGTSYYLGALEAFMEMSEATNLDMIFPDVTRYDLKNENAINIKALGFYCIFRRN